MSDTRSAKDEANRFLLEGVQCYPDALVALTAFRREVHERCIALVKAHLDRLGEAIGDKELEKEHIEPGDWNSDTEAYLYVKVQSPQMTKLEFYAGVGWWEDDSGERRFGVDAGFWVPRKLYDRLKKTVKGAWEKRQLDLWEEDGIWLSRKMELAEACSFHEKLGEIIEIWTEAGEDCGGFLKVLAEASED
jgi:hypothetical protein